MQGWILTCKPQNFYFCSFKLCFLVWKWPTLPFLLVFLLFFPQVMKSTTWSQTRMFVVQCFWRENPERKETFSCRRWPKTKSIFSFSIQPLKWKTSLFVQIHYWKTPCQCVLLAIYFHLPRERFVCELNKSMRKKEQKGSLSTWHRR